MDFKKGDLVEVRSYGDEWFPRIYLVYNESNKDGARHVVANPNTGAVGSWKHCRHRRPDFKVNATVWVRGSENDPWLPRHAAGWDDDVDCIVCYCNGSTSHTSTAVGTWKYYRTTAPK